MTTHGSPRASLEYEATLWAQGYAHIAGLDEVGRGAWAGPVVAAAVILPPDLLACASLVGSVHDSKQLTPRQRTLLVPAITAVAIAIGVGSIPAATIDEVGIVPATRQAMRQALAALPSPPDYLLIDALRLPDVGIPQRPLIHGDALSLSIAAAAIIAKVTRDQTLTEMDVLFPGYGFARHKGYGVPAHRSALDRLGPCPEHRRSFRPLAAMQPSLWEQPA